MTIQNTNPSEATPKKPTHSLRKKTGYDKNVSFETIGVAWERENGGLYIKLHGTQIIDSAFYAFPIEQAETPDGTE